MTQKLFIDLFIVMSHSKAKARARTTTKAGKFVIRVFNVPL